MSQGECEILLGCCLSQESRVIEDDDTDEVESEGDEVVDMEGGGSCSRILRLEDARGRMVDMMVDDGGEEGRELLFQCHLQVTNELSVKIIQVRIEMDSDMSIGRTIRVGPV